jgi:hypothetical protein
LIDGNDKKIDGRMIREWHLKPDGWIVARIVRKEGKKPLVSS